MQARNSYWAKIGYADPGEYRQPLPHDLALPDLVPIGATVRTSYGTGGVVTAVYRYPVNVAAGQTRDCWTIEITDFRPRGKITRGWLNEYVVHDGRIRALFMANDDEVFVDEAPASEALPHPMPPPDALPLFAWGGLHA
jgi:hypothetical protein